MFVPRRFKAQGAEVVARARALKTHKVALKRKQHGHASLEPWGPGMQARNLSPFVVVECNEMK